MSTVKKAPLRKCAVCGEMKAKKELIRVVRTTEDDADIEIDLTGKKNGRGAYICRLEECIEKAAKTKALERSLKMQISKDVYDKLKKELNDL